MRWTTVLIATLCVGLFLVGTATYAQKQIKGAVINRDGAPQSGCRVDITGPAGSSPSVWTNAEGAFFLESPRYGDYTVDVLQGERRQTFKVTVNEYGLHPSTLVVDW